MFTTKRSFDDGHPPSAKRARREKDQGVMASTTPRCTMSAEACCQALQHTATTPEALEALLTHPELLRAYARLGTKAYFYVTYALAHAKDSPMVASKCLHVLTQMVPLGSPAAFRATNVTTYIEQAVRLYPQLQVCGMALIHAIATREGASRGHFTNIHHFPATSATVATQSSYGRAAVSR